MMDALISFGKGWSQPAAYLEVKNVGTLSPHLTSRLSAKWLSK